jgi:hypothetical protein
VKCGLDNCGVWMRVVGTVGDMRNENPATPPGPEIYMAYRQHPYDANDLHIVVRARGRHFRRSQDYGPDRSRDTPQSEYA